MLKEDIKKVKDQGKLFERLSSDYDLGRRKSLSFLRLIFFPIASQKNADIPKTKRRYRFLMYSIE